MPRTNANAAAPHRFSVYPVLKKHFRGLSTPAKTEKTFWKQVDNPAWSLPKGSKQGVPTYAIMGGQAMERAVCYFWDPRRRGMAAQRDPQEGCVTWRYYTTARALQPRKPYDLAVLRHRATLGMVSPSLRRAPLCLRPVRSPAPPRWRSLNALAVRAARAKQPDGGGCGGAALGLGTAA